MSRIAIITVLAAAVLVVLAPTTQGQLIEIGLIAEIYLVEDYDNLLGGNVQVGDLITGSYTYDSSMTPASTSPTGALYVFNSSDVGAVLETNGLTFQTDSSNVDFQMGIANESGPLSWDGLWFRSHNNLSLADDIDIDISFTLTDYSGTANEDTNLSTDAPILQNFDVNCLRIEGLIPATDTSSKQHFIINAEVTSAWLIPEPGTLVLLAIGSVMFRRRSY